ncbi:MAG TPA: histidine kinase [Mucilaginibacter sp.]|jgi:hypothetical protein
MAAVLSNQNWLIKYKLYHLPFWILYNYLLWALKVNSPLGAASTIFFSVFFVKFIFYVIFPAIAVYFNLYFLIPRFLEKDRYIEYISYLVLTIIICAALIVPGYYITSYLYGGTVETVYRVHGPNKFYQLFKEDPLRSTIACTTLAMSIKLTKNWIQTERRQRQLEKEKLETELKFLKYQFNPHFLFNSINSIFFLIHKNPDMASESLAKFSELLRHQLYECNENQIPLSKEIAYLENFIELEKLRQNEDVEVNFEVNALQTDHLGIAPFILMTFVENAFKHISRHSEKSNWIVIKLTVDKLHLDLFVANSKSPGDMTQVVNYGGIGLKNVQRRLDLVYPENYKLDIKNEDDRFEVRLRVTLTELVLSPTMQMA